MSLINSLLPYYVIYEILDFLPLESVSHIKTVSHSMSSYFQTRLYNQINHFYKIINNTNYPKPTNPININSPLPGFFKPNAHIIYYLLISLERPNFFFRMISPTTLHQHMLPRYSTLSGFIPFIKIPTAMGFYKLISIYPYTENPELFVVDSLGGMSSSDREFNIKLYYTKTHQTYKHPLTFQELFPKLLPFAL